jgi:hypothetical protein
MKRTTAKTFEMIPSVQSRIDLPAPITFIPALPVRLEEMPGLTFYGVVDTGAEISIITSEVFKNSGLPKKPVGNVMISTGENVQTVEIIKFSLAICDKDFSPWLRFNDVPFALMPERALYTRNKIVLGVDGCLSNLRLDIDYPHQKINVTASRRLLSSESDIDEPELPSRIREGKELIELGSYASAVTMIAAGLEEVVISYLGSSIESRRTWGQLRGLMTHEGLSPESRQRVSDIMRIRNIAVHGASGQSVSEVDARNALNHARAIILELANLRDYLRR